MTGNNHHVKRAIIMAAGEGRRLQPLTFHVPKPLVSVNGTRMIESVIDALHANGIYEIHVVVGYLKEQFQVLLDKYEGLDLIENPYYKSCNNISSLYVARDYLSDCIILDGDQIVHDSSALAPEFNLSGYNAVWTDDKTDEWLLDVEDGVVAGCSRIGGSHGWQLYSVSRWSESDGLRLRGHVEQEFRKGNTQIYWDDVALFCYPSEYRLGIREMHRDDIVEIDSLAELIAIDPSYRRYADES